MNPENLETLASGSNSAMKKSQKTGFPKNVSLALVQKILYFLYIGRKLKKKKIEKYFRVSLSREESGALGHLSVSIVFGQLDNK